MRSGIQEKGSWGPEDLQRLTRDEYIRWLYYDIKAGSMAQVGEMMGMTKGQINHILKKGIKK